MSSQIASIGYDPTTKRLEIEFKRNGSVYQYENVPPDLADSLARSESVGSFFHNHIKGNSAYPYTKVA